MRERDIIWQEQRLEEILFSGTDPVSKVQQIIRLGFDPEVADEIVERHQMGVQAPVYYERLDFADFDDDAADELVIVEESEMHDHAKTKSAKPKKIKEDYDTAA
jgi:L-lysine 2,3-aminomutase